MSAVESTGTSSGTQKQYGNMKSLFGGVFFISSFIFKKGGDMKR
jgi:hypothetical protein